MNDHFPVKHRIEDGQLPQAKRLKTAQLDSGVREFPTRPLSRFNHAFPFYRQPEENGCFSQDSGRAFHCDKSQMKFYIPPSDSKNVSFDLSQGYAEMIRKDESKKEFIDDMLKWIMKHSAKFEIQQVAKTNISISENKPTKKITSLHTDFVCWRGLLTRLLCTPYENRDNWMIAVTLFKGTYFLCEFETDEKRRQKESTTQRQDEMCCWGWKFEQYLTADVPGGVPNTSVPVNNNEGFCSVVRTRLSKHSLVFGGEVDCIDPTLGSRNKYVELKTTRELESPRQKENFLRYKLIKWWAQSFLIGIGQIVAGMRDDDGVVHKLEQFQTSRIPDMVKEIRNGWSAAVCFNFLDQFLSFIKDVVKVDDPRVAYVCRWQPGESVSCKKMKPDSDFVFLPDWFINWEAWG